MEIQDFITLEKKDGIATLWLDHKLEKMNVVSPEIIDILDSAFKELASDDSIKAAVFISKKDDFIAGADVKSFSIEKEGEFKPYQEKGHRSLAALEQSKKPVVAAIHGACMGLGTEIALACHARICSDSPKTKIALPEVMLGLLPGGGGTQRLPRRIGIQRALDMMLTGRNIYPYQAKKMGLVDEVTNVHKLHHAALIMARQLVDKPLISKRKTSLLNKFIEGTSIGRSILFKQARKMAYKQSQGNYPAIPAIIDCVETGFSKGAKAGYQKELDHFEKLILSPESKALRSLFFRITDNKKNPYSKSPEKLNALGMIGAGFMGAGIVEISISKGINVLFKDIKEEVISSAERQIWKSLQKKVRRKAISKMDAEKQMGSVHGQLSYSNFDKVDIVIEAVLEQMPLKKIIIGEVETQCKKEVIFATNTSSLSVTEMAKHAKKPENVIGMHYFSPVPKMPLLEIVTHEETDQEVVASCYDFGLKQGKTVIVVKDCPGFYVNRILGPYLNECLTMVDEGIAFEFIDKALKKKGFPVGPITLLDEVGLDIAAHATESNREAVKSREGITISEGVINMFKDGRLGKKNKLGFYLYDKKGKRKGPDSTAYKYFKGNGKNSLPLEETQNRPLMLMLNEAVLCLEEGIISSAKDGDLGGVLGIGFLPFTGGPFSAMNYWGLSKVVTIMKELEQKYGPRFKPAKMLKELADSGKDFTAYKESKIERADMPE